MKIQGTMKYANQTILPKQKFAKTRKLQVVLIITYQAQGFTLSNKSVEISASLGFNSAKKISLTPFIQHFL